MGAPSCCGRYLEVGGKGAREALSNGADSSPRTRAGDAITGSSDDSAVKLPKVNFAVVEKSWGDFRCRGMVTSTVDDGGIVGRRIGKGCCAGYVDRASSRKEGGVTVVGQLWV